MITMILQKSASNELWWIGGALALFLLGLIVVTLFRFAKDHLHPPPDSGHRGEDEPHQLPRMPH